ncbi:MAG: DUF952 domain-containing protein [Caulobacterales bacterium]
MSTPSRIYKIIDQATWAEASAATDWLGSELDRRDGYIHFSAAAQVGATLALHYAGRDDLLVLEFDTSPWGDQLVWEPSRGGALFPHLYAPLAVSQASRMWPVRVAPDGACALPDDFPS